MLVDIESQESHLLLNPRIQEVEAARWKLLFHELNLKGHVWLTTSGSTQMKLVGLSKKALLVSAKSINLHLHCTQQDVWVNPLPIFHVGGLGILIRSHLTQSKLFEFSNKWNAKTFHDFLHEKNATLTSLVPTQVYDLITQELKSPSSLRAVLVGGGALDKSLYLKARKLGWPLLPSYGMTECSSTVAAASLETLLTPETYPPLTILPHIVIKIEDSKIRIKSAALLTCVAFFQGDQSVVKYQTSDWYQTEDSGFLQGSTLNIQGRTSDFVKIGGESVQISHLEKILEEIKLGRGIVYDIAICAVPDERLGHVIHLFSTHHDAMHIQSIFNQRVLPFERIRKIHLIDKIPRSSLGKVLKSKLIADLSCPCARPKN